SSIVKDAGPEAAVVVASQGHYDEDALQVILAAPVAYVGLVASHKRGATVRSMLSDSGVANVAAIRSPAGLDLGARTAPEVALSILAEIVQSNREREVTAVASPSAPAVASAVSRTAVDPVCHMDVEIATARHTAEIDGTVYYFCCANCRVRFVKDPHAFLSRSA